MLNAIPRIGPDQGFNIQPPSGPLPLVAGGDAIAVYNSAVNKKLGKLIIANIGTGTIKYAFNTPATTNLYHDIIPAASADEAGDGGHLTLDREYSLRNFLAIGTLYLFSDAGTKITVQFFERTDVI